jgi:hypothetical protein
VARQVQAPIAINATGGAYTAITAKAFSRYTEIAEDGSGSAAGLTVQWPNGNVDNYPPSAQPIKIGNPGGGAGSLVGQPGQPTNFPGGVAVPATQYCQIKSMGAATAVRVTEDN